MIYQFVALLVVHWIADFVLQTHWQASNKSKNNEALLRHVAIYTVILTAAVLMIFLTASLGSVLLFVAINAVLHFATDWCTSRWTSKLFIGQFDTIIVPWVMKRDFNPHNFFVVIGLDQLIHQLTLAGTMILFFGTV